MEPVYERKTSTVDLEMGWVVQHSLVLLERCDCGHRRKVEGVAEVTSEHPSRCHIAHPDACLRDALHSGAHLFFRHIGADGHADYVGNHGGAPFAANIGSTPSQSGHEQRIW